MELEVILYLCAAVLIFIAVYVFFTQKPPVQMRERVQEDTCAICLENIQHEAQASCGHVYCGIGYAVKCIVDLWEKQFRPAQAKCPICRRLISLMVANFRPSSDEERQLQASIDDYNVRYSDSARSLWHKICDIPFVIRRILHDLTTTETLSRAFVYSIILAAIVLYVILPNDLLSEAEIGPLGLLDDVFGFSVGVFWVALKYYIALGQDSAERLSRAR